MSRSESPRLAPPIDADGTLPATAADPAVFQYYIANYGPKVNVFVDHSQVVQLAAVRRGIWGNNTLFGRVVTFDGES